MAVVAVGMAAYGAATWAGFAAYAGMAATVAMSAYSMWETSKQVIKSEGPRLNDLRVMSSTYGGDLPVIYGTMRVKGEVIWKPNIIEVATTQSRGGKGGGPKQTSTTYSYYANFAVALAQGEVKHVRRIWANGKLIYDVAYPDTPQEAAAVVGKLAEGLASDGISFRFYSGTETQLPDSLIESYEGVGNTPAYRGTAYIVFERLPLADYGNQLPNINVEICNGEELEFVKLGKIQHPSDVGVNPDGTTNSPFFVVNARAGVTTLGYYVQGSYNMLVADYNAQGRLLNKTYLPNGGSKYVQPLEQQPNDMLIVANGSKPYTKPRGFWADRFPSPAITVDSGDWWSAAYNSDQDSRKVVLRKYSRRGRIKLEVPAPFTLLPQQCWSLSWDGADLLTASTNSISEELIVFRNSTGAVLYRGSYSGFFPAGSIPASNWAITITRKYIVAPFTNNQVYLYTYDVVGNTIQNVTLAKTINSQVVASSYSQMGVNRGILVGEDIFSLQPLVKRVHVPLGDVITSLLKPLTVDTTALNGILVKGYAATETGRGAVEVLCAAYGFDLVEEGDGKVKAVKRGSSAVKVIDEGDTVNES